MKPEVVTRINCKRLIINYVLTLILGFEKNLLMEVYFAMVGKQDYRIVGFAILFLLCWMGFSPLACRSAMVWSDDFNDGDYDGWTICENLALGSK